MKPSSRPIVAALRRGYAAQAAAKSDAKVAASKHAPQISRLANGLTVATLENYSPVSRVSMLYNAGSRHEDASSQGVTHFLRSAASLGTKKCTSFGLVRNVQQIGGNLTITASRDHLIYSMECTRNALEVGTEFLNHATSPAFKPWEVEAMNGQLNLDLAIHNDQTDAVLMEALHKAAYRDGLGNSLFMPAHKLGTHTPEQLHSYVDKHLNPANLTIVGVGVDHEYLMHILSHKLSLGKLEAGAAVKATPAQYHAGEERVSNNSGFVHAAVVTEGVGLGSPDMLPLAVLQKALGTGPYVKYGSSSNSKAAQAAAQATSNPFAVSALNINHSDSGLFGFYAVTSAKDAGNVLKSLVAQFSSATKGSLTDADVDRAKNQLKADVQMTLESDGAILDDMGAQVALSGQILQLDSICQAIDAIKAADVQAVAKKVINGKPSMAAVGDLSYTPYLDQLV